MLRYDKENYVAAYEVLKQSFELQQSNSSAEE